MNMALTDKIGQLISTGERCSDRRQELFDRYMGEPRGDEAKGRSSVLTSEIFDVVESVKAELMDLVAGEQRVASFIADSAEDADSADLETEACNRLFWEINNGFDLLQTACTAGLIEQNGYVRHDWVSEEVVRIEEFSGLSVEQASQIEMQYAQDESVQEVEILELEGVEVVDVETEDGTQEAYIPTGEDIAVKVRCTKAVDRYEITPVAKGDIILPRRWHKPSLKDAPFVAIMHTEMTKADYRALGFAEGSVDALHNGTQTDEEDNRHSTKNNPDGANEDDDTLLTYECYVIDTDEDPQSLKRVWVSSDAKTIMEWDDGKEAVDEVDRIPVTAWTPIPVPFRHNGRALAEVVEDLEAVNTTLMRQALDNIYATNYARPVVSEEQQTVHTYVDLASPDHGAAIRVTGNAQTAIAWQMPPSIAGAVLPMMDRVSQAKEERTGVTKLSQGLDQNTLNQTAQGQQMLLSQGQKRLKLIARNFGEFIREIFVAMHADLRKGNIKSLNFNMGGSWSETNPALWPERTAMRVSIGTGNGDRQEKQATLGLVASFQEKLAAAGSALVDEPKMFATIDRMVRLGGYSGAEAFLNDPEGQVYQQAMAAKKAQPPKPDPALILANAEAEKARGQAAKAEAEAMLKMAEIEANEREADRRHAERMAELQIKARQAELADTKVAADINAKAEAQDLAEKAQADDMQIDRAKLALEAART